MYSASRCIQCLKTANQNMLMQHRKFASSKCDDVVNLLADTLQTNSMRSRQVEGDSVSWSVMKTKETIVKQKGKKRKIKKNKMQFYVPQTTTAFSNFSNLDESLRVSLNSQFSSLLPIQEKVLPNSLQNRSMMIQSETGSGKTLTYVIPVVNALLHGHLDANNRCIVIAPSKELCSQIYNVFLSLVPMASSVILLGADHSRSASQQNKQIQQGSPIIVTTPASLNSKLKHGVLRLVGTSKIVVDEFDRLFGGSDFEDQVHHIIAGLARKRVNSPRRPQFLITSATISDEMKSFVLKHIPDIMIEETLNVSPPTLDHKWVISPLHRRTETLLKLLEENTDESNKCRKCIIFVQRLEIGDGVFEALRDEGYFVTMINGDMTAGKRQTVFRDYKNGSYDILIATDLIARGIDIPDCEMVIQIQPGEDVDMYLHRAGRCARAGRAGTSYVIASDADFNDRAFYNLVRQQLHVDTIDATSFLPEKESGVVSVLENSLHHVAKKDELAFSIDIAMTESVTFYQKLIADLGLRPVNAGQVSDKMIFGIWYSSPVEAWAAESVIKEYFKSNCLPEPEMGMYRHKSRTRSVMNWNAYFSEIRKTKKEEEKLRYKNFVKQEMGKKRIRKGRYKFKQYLPGS